MGYLSLVGSNILLLVVVQHQVIILEFLQEKMGARPFTLPSCRISALQLALGKCHLLLLTLMFSAAAFLLGLEQKS